MENSKVKFDPGFAPIVVDYIGNVGYTYYMFSSIKDIKLKKINFNFIYKKLENSLKISICFYIGCLLWASCLIHELNKEVVGNKLLNENVTQEEYTSEIDFLLDFIENKYPRDTKYFQNRIYCPDKRYIPILKAYKDFLILNEGFVKCLNTNQIKLPDYLKILDDVNITKTKNKIFNSIETGDLTTLLDEFDLLF